MPATAHQAIVPYNLVLADPHLGQLIQRAKSSVRRAQAEAFSRFPQASPDYHHRAIQRQMSYEELQNEVVQRHLNNQTRPPESVSSSIRNAKADACNRQPSGQLSSPLTPVDARQIFDAWEHRQTGSSGSLSGISQALL
jgi:hypothetical protein